MVLQHICLKRTLIDTHFDVQKVVIININDSHCFQLSEAVWKYGWQQATNMTINSYVEKYANLSTLEQSIRKLTSMLENLSAANMDVGQLFETIGWGTLDGSFKM